MYSTSAIHNQTKGLYVATSSQQFVINLEISMTFISVLDGHIFNLNPKADVAKCRPYAPPPPPQHTYIHSYIFGGTYTMRELYLSYRMQIYECLDHFKQIRLFM